MFNSLTTTKKRNNKTTHNKNAKQNSLTNAAAAAASSSSLLSATTTATGTIYSTITTGTKTGITTTGGTAATNDSNERLERSNKLDAIIRQQQQQSRQRQRSLTPRESTESAAAAASFCNATTTTATTTLVNCCRDVNCRFNAVQCTATAPPATLQPLENGNGYNCNDAYNCRERSSASMEKSFAPTASSSSSNCYSHSKSSSNNATKNATSSKDATTTAAAEFATANKHLRQQQQKPNVASSSSSFMFTWNWLSSHHVTRSIAARLLESQFTINVRLDIFSWILFFLAFCTRFYRLATPAHIVFDELHYGKYVSHYMRHMFFFDQHPPLGKQLIAAVAHLAGDFNGNATFSRIGAAYGNHVPVFWLRFLPALCGSLLAPVVYKLLLKAGLKRWTSLLGGLLIIFDNALLTQSRFILMESMLLLFSTLGLYALLQFQRSRFAGFTWIISGLSASILLTCATSVKYAGFFTFCLAVYLMCRYLWDLLYDCHVTDFQIAMQTLTHILIFTLVPLCVYLGIFYVHLQTLTHAGPHDSAMTSAFQASLEGGLASITRGQPLNVVHGSQITLRHTHGRLCWLHSHNHVYPVRYPDKRGSSHQQQVTCYSFKDVNNWWIVKRPERDELVVGDEPDVIRDGDIIQLVHGITSRALNSHDVAAPLTPQCQEVSCYIDYNIKMEPEMLWRVEILNKDAEGDVWHAIKSQIRLIHTTTGAALRFSGRQLPDWGFNQHEVVADRVIENEDAIWNVEEHRYTKTHDERERERQLLNAEMLPTQKTVLSFWDKFIELQTKMFWNIKQVQSHMYSSEPIEWPLLDKGIAYWVDSKSNGQIHLLGNIVIWYTATVGVLIYAALGIFYMIRRRRLCYDLEPYEWQRFLAMGDLFFVGYLLHYLPYFLVDRTLFLHNYLPALVFKLQLLCYVIEHIDYLLRCFFTKRDAWLLVVPIYRFGVLLWFTLVVWIFWRFMPLSYGFFQLSTNDVIALRWKDTWDFILQKEYQITEKSLEMN